jgi:hypothetical protein
VAIADLHLTIGQASPNKKYRSSNDRKRKGTFIASAPNDDLPAGCFAGVDRDSKKSVKEEISKESPSMPIVQLYGISRFQGFRFHDY